MARYKNFIISLLIGLLYSGRIFAQVPLPDHYLVSPNAASLGEYGEVPVSLYTGIPEISIPIYELKSGAHSLPIGLAYHGGGIRPDRHPGWVGLGWTLMAGGSITRVVNGLPDESDCYNALPPEIPSQDFQMVRGKMGLIYNPDYASMPGNGGGSCKSYTLGKFNPEMKVQDIEMSYRDKVDTQPDLFSFNVSGLSGSFFYNGEREMWVVQCNRPVKVELNITDETNFSKPFARRSGAESFNQVRSKSFNNFTLIDEYGTRYNFGGKDIPESIEYSVGFFTQNTEELAATTWHLTSIQYRDGRTITFKYTRKNYIVQLGIYENFTYQSFQNIPHVFYNGRQLEGQGFKSHINPNFDYAQGSLIVPAYLSEITDGKTHIYFDIEESKELEYDLRRIYYNHHHGEQPQSVYDMPYLQEFKPDGSPELNRPGSIDCIDSLKWFKLNQIRVTNSENNLIKKFALKYNIDEDSLKSKQRLALTSLSEIDLQSGSEGPCHRFEYDNIGALPKYCTYNVDHWDFYKDTGIITEFEEYNQTRRNIKLIVEFTPLSNDKTIVSTSPEPGNWDYKINLDDEVILPSYAPNYSRKSPYYMARNADSSTATIGSLMKIVYPTGGYTRFEYENHTYASYVDSTRTQTIKTDRPELAGGLRIKKLINSADGTTDGEVVTKEFFYHNLKTENEKASSGILLRPRQYSYVKGGFSGLPISYNPPAFVKVYSAQSLHPVACNGDGSHIGYTWVTEKYPDGSMSVSNFTNFDNGHPDFPYEFDNAGGLGASFPYASLAMERGLLISKTDYDATGQIERQMTCEYDSLEREKPFLHNIHANYHGFLIFHVEGYFREVFPSKLFYHTMYPKGNTVTEYFNGTEMQKTSTAYRYTPERQIENIAVTDPDNTIRIKELYYPTNYPGLSNSSGLLDFRNTLSMGTLLKECNLMKRGSVVQSMDSTLYHYAIENPVYPYKVELFKGNSKYPEITKFSYDTKNNPIYVESTGGEDKTVYIWGYSHQYPVAAIKNATKAEVEAVFSDLNLFAAAEVPDFSRLESLRNALPDALISIYKYKPGIGVTECISADRQVITYHYDALGRLSYTKDGDGNIVTVNEYRFAGDNLRILP